MFHVARSLKILDSKKNKRSTIQCRWGKDLSFGKFTFGFVSAGFGMRLPAQMNQDEHPPLIEQPTLHMNACDLICSDAAGRTD